MIRHAAAVLATLVLVAGCARKPVVREVAQVGTTSARLRAGVNLSDELVKACRVRFENTALAPKFDFDEAALLPQDREVLAQVARCVTTGPLAGKGLVLVGRADPRGEDEYNMVLGESRADSVLTYLGHLGVGAERMQKTSRGELDAVGTDEDGFRQDRRVDLALR
jgi:peptidoglycan-associated lipoprotein